VASTGCIDRKASGCTGEIMTEYITREEHEAALMQIHAEIAHDRKRMSPISALWNPKREYRGC
jgi:hypothetical protein